MIAAFIQQRGATVFPPGAASGLHWHKPTALGNPREATEWLTGKVTAKCNEENLAKAKILTMLQDLGGRVVGTDGQVSSRLKLQNDARNWFFNPRCRQDFEAWCDTAGFDPDYVRERARQIEATGLPQHRAAPGKGNRFLERKAYRDRTGR